MHCRTGRNTVIGQHNCFIFQIGPLSSLKVKRLTSFDFGQMRKAHILYFGLRETDPARHMVVYDYLWVHAINDRTNCDFGLARHTDLAHKCQIQRQMMGLADLLGHWNPATGQGDNDCTAQGQVGQGRRQLIACIGSVGKVGDWRHRVSFRLVLGVSKSRVVWFRCGRLILLKAS